MLKPSRFEFDAYLRHLRVHLKCRATQLDTEIACSRLKLGYESIKKIFIAVENGRKALNVNSIVKLSSYLYKFNVCIL